MSIRKYRQKNGLTQKALSQSSGIPQPTIAMVELGKREMSAEMMRKLNALDPQAFPLPKWICPDCQTEEEAA